MKVYIPSYLGDVQLQSQDGRVVLSYEALTQGEQGCIERFLKAYKLRMTPEKGEIAIPGTMQEVHKKFLKCFKANKAVISAIKLKDGKLELVQDFPEGEGVGVTTVKPARGCPMPVYEKEIRASKVLKVFLLPQQQTDFDMHRAFVARGNYTGNPYLLTSRWNPECEHRGVLWSLAESRRICASLNEIPPSEELLAMKLCIECDERNFVGLS